MNLLQLVQRLQSECSVSGNPLASIASATGETIRLVNWTRSAWLDIQSMEEQWEFMRQPFSFPLVAQKYSYTPGDANIMQFASWKQDSLRIYQGTTDARGETALGAMRYDDWRDLYQFGANRTNYSRPVAFAVSPEKNLVFGATPDAIYTVNGEYYTQPVDLVADLDVPNIPTQYHMLIVYRAMEHYGYHEVAAEALQRAAKMGGALLSRLRTHTLQPMTFGRALA
jgi:hypothetical protein